MKARLATSDAVQAKVSASTAYAMRALDRAMLIAEDQLLIGEALLTRLEEKFTSVNWR